MKNEKTALRVLRQFPWLWAIDNQLTPSKLEVRVERVSEEALFQLVDLSNPLREFWVYRTCQSEHCDVTILGCKKITGSQFFKGIGYLGRLAFYHHAVKPTQMLNIAVVDRYERDGKVAECAYGRTKSIIVYKDPSSRVTLDEFLRGLQPKLEQYSQAAIITQAS